MSEWGQTLYIRRVGVVNCSVYLFTLSQKKGNDFCSYLHGGVLPFHRVGRKLFFQVVGIGNPPPLHPQASGPHPFGSGGAHSIEGEGVGESQFRRGDIHYTVVFYIYTYVLCGPFLFPRSSKHLDCQI